MKIKENKRGKNIFYLICVYLLFQLFLGGYINNCHASFKLDKEPIDVVYKYINLKDKNLVREGIPQIQKDYDNEELRYSLRSVIKNIPWIRKIFIIMPNDRVPYLKDIKEIKDKIVYIKDKDILGFDSESSITFEHNALYKLKNFGVSDNFIYMNDDCFIGKPLSKSDFFYSKHGNIFPYCPYEKKRLSNNVFEEVKRIFEYLKNIVSSQPCSHSSLDYKYQTMLSHMLLYKIFNRKDIMISSIPEWTIHNAIALNINDLVELHNIVKSNYEFSYELFNAKFRTNKQITFEPLYSFYFLNKENRKQKSFGEIYIDSCQAPDYDGSNNLFCINTGDKKYTPQDFVKAKLAMNRLFPRRTIYEIPEIENGIYYIASMINENKVLDISNANTKSGAKLQIYDKNGTFAQRFKITYIDGYYEILPMCSNKALDVKYGSNNPKTLIWQYERNKSDAQKWYIIPDNNCYYIVSKCNNLFMDVAQGETKNGTYIWCYPCNCTNAQKFRFIKC